MIILNYEDLTTAQHDDFFNFLKNTQNDKSPASLNMWHDDWENKNNSLPYILEKTERFKNNNGEFHVLFDNARIVACGGVYKSDFDRNISLAGTRTWVDRSYRNKSLVREFILPVHKKWSIENDCKIIVLCFNDYNKNLISTFQRTRLGEDSDRILKREKHHLFYSGIHELDFPITIQYTPQWIIYEKLEDWDFDWESIRC